MENNSDNTLPRTGGEPVTTEDAPAEMSLEGRKAQLEKKVSEELDRKPDVSPAEDRPYAYEGVYADPFDKSAEPKKPKFSGGSRAYLVLLIGVTAAFIIGFVIECGRAYSENGLFGGDLDRFVMPSPDDGDSPFGGMFPFEFDLPDDDDAPDTNDDSDADISADSNLVKAPGEDDILDPNAKPIEAEDQPDDIDSPEYSARKAYKVVENSVVNVVVYTDPKYIGDDVYKDGTGTGIVISSSGYIITNSHVLDDSTERGVEIIMKSGERYAAAIVGCDSRTDLAVLKIDADDLTAVSFVDSDQVEVGQDAIVVGNPGGVNYSHSLTRGCVSAVNRSIPTRSMVSYIQTDAAINPGNSGGPLLNSAGQVMGITTIKIANTDYEGMGFAIPSNLAIEIANDLIRQGYVDGRVRLGIMASVYDGGLTSGIEGIVIKDILPDSPLNDTEVKAGDVITAINDVPTPNFSVFYSELGEYEPGDEVTLKLYREPSPGDAGKTYTVKTELLEDTGDK